jgi:stage V sporulation protein D (sporulation-specific penicillin-binding protein)
LDLAIYAFGQNFNVTLLQQVTAISAVANGGYLVTPHFIKEITDAEGNVVYSYENAVRRQVISAETSKKVSEVLEDGVSGDGGAKNAYVAGYRIAAKTGTSEKKDTKSEYTDTPYVCSTVAYAPAEDPKLTALILVDEPTEGVLYASTIAAPYIGKLLEEALPYYGVEAKYTEEELKNQTVSAPALVQARVPVAVDLAEMLGFEVEIVGDGEYVRAQSPATGVEVEPGSAKIILYTTDEAASQKATVKVPNLVGMTAVAANGTLTNLGLNIKILGAKNYTSGKGAVVVEQSIPAGQTVDKGSVIEVTFRHMDVED